MAERAMQVAAQHPKGEGGAARVDVEKRLFLDGIAGQAGGVAEGDAQHAGMIGAQLTHPASAGRDEAAMAARQAAKLGAFGAEKPAGSSMAVEPFS